MILKVLFVLAALIAAVLVFAATKPPRLRVQRWVIIDAPPQTIFPLINDFHNWSRWAPQDKEDVNMKRTYSGSPSGEGAISQWHGTGSVFVNMDRLMGKHFETGLHNLKIVAEE